MKLGPSDLRLRHQKYESEYKMTRNTLENSISLLENVRHKWNYGASLPRFVFAWSVCCTVRAPCSALCQKAIANLLPATDDGVSDIVLNNSSIAAEGSHRIAWKLRKSPRMRSFPALERRGQPVGLRLAGIRRDRQYCL